MKYKKLFFLTVLFILSIILLISCDVQVDEHAITITFNANGGEFSDSDTYITNTNGRIIKFPNHPTREGYTFNGWYLDNETYNDKFNAQALQAVPMDSVTVYAQWIKNPETIDYYVVFDSKGGEEVESMYFHYTEPNYYYNNTSLDQAELWLPSSQRVGYNFNGWYLDEDYNQRVDYINYELYSLKTNIKLYAEWTILTYNVMFYGINYNDYIIVQVEHGSNAVPPVFTRKGYSFIGWDKSLDNIIENTHIIALWDINKYNISFDTQGGVLEGDEDNKSIDYNSLVGTLPTATKDKMLFSGWNTKPDGSGLIFNENSRYKYEEDTILYAIWYTEGLSFKAINNTYEVSQGDASCEHIVIPYHYNNQIVRSIGSSGFANSNLKSVVIPNSVAIIRSVAFYNCEFLEELYIPESVIEIEGNAFKNCINLIKIYSLGSITKLSNGILDNCYELDYILLPDTLIEIGPHMFSNNVKLTQITIPKNVEIIGENSRNPFFRCFNLKEIIVDVDNENFHSLDGVLYKGDMLLVYPKGKDESEFLIPQGVTRIASHSIASNSYLTSLTIPDSVYIIDSKYDLLSYNLNYENVDGLIYYNNILVTQIDRYNTSPIVIREGTISIAGSALESSSATHITIPEGVRSIGDNAFYLSYTTHFELPESLEYIGYQAFRAYFNSIIIKSNEIPANNNAFYFPDYRPKPYIYVKDHLLNEYKSLSIWSQYNDNYYAFSVINDNGLAIDNDVAFQYLGNNPVAFIPSNVIHIKENTFAHNAFVAEINVDNDNQHYKSIDGVVYSSDMKNLIVYPNAKLGKYYLIPDSVININDYAFYNVNYLNALTIQENVEHIGAHAFCNNKTLKSLILLGDAPTLKRYTFNFNSLYYDDIIKINIKYRDNYYSDPLWRDISRYYSFYDNISFVDDKYIITNNDNLISYIGNDNEIVIPSDIKRISTYAFIGNSQITKLIIHNEVVMEYSSLNGLSNLKELTMPINSISYDKSIIGYYFGNTYYDNSSVSIQYYRVGSGYMSFAPPTRLPNSLETITINSSINTIPFSSLSNIPNIKTVIFNESIEIIEEKALYSNTQLNKIILHSVIPPIVNGIIHQEMQNIMIYVPYESLDAYKNAEFWSDFADNIIPIEN